MKDNVKIGIVVTSGIISLTHFILSFVIVPHIFGIILSTTMLLFNIIYFVYLIKIKKQISEDFKVQYEMIGKK